MSVKVDKKSQNNHTRERNSLLRNLFATFLKSLLKYLLSNFPIYDLKRLSSSFELTYSKVSNRSGGGEVGYRGGWKKYQKLIVGGRDGWTSEGWGV